MLCQDCATRVSRESVREPLKQPQRFATGGCAPSLRCRSGPRCRGCNGLFWQAKQCAVVRARQVAVKALHEALATVLVTFHHFQHHRTCQNLAASVLLPCDLGRRSSLSGFDLLLLRFELFELLFLRLDFFLNACCHFLPSVVVSESILATHFARLTWLE